MKRAPFMKRTLAAALSVPALLVPFLAACTQESAPVDATPAPQPSAVAADAASPSTDEDAGPDDDASAEKEASAQVDAAVANGEFEASEGDFSVKTKFDVFGAGKDKASKQLVIIGEHPKYGTINIFVPDVKPTGEVRCTSTLDTSPSVVLERAKTPYTSDATLNANPYAVACQIQFQQWGPKVGDTVKAGWGATVRSSTGKSLSLGGRFQVVRE